MTFVCKGERLVLTGFSNALHARLETFVGKRLRIERKADWKLIEAERKLAQIVSAMLITMRRQLDQRT